MISTEAINDMWFMQFAGTALFGIPNGDYVGGIPVMVRHSFAPLHREQIYAERDLVETGHKDLMETGICSALPYCPTEEDFNSDE
jgi:hypothetical protein